MDVETKRWSEKIGSQLYLYGNIASAKEIILTVDFILNKKPIKESCNCNSEGNLLVMVLGQDFNIVSKSTSPWVNQKICVKSSLPIKTLLKSSKLQ